MLCCLLIATGAATDTTPDATRGRWRFAASDGYLPRRLPDISPPTTSAAATEAATGTTPMQPPMQVKRVARTIRGNMVPHSTPDPQGTPTERKLTKKNLDNPHAS